MKDVLPFAAIAAMTMAAPYLITFGIGNIYLLLIIRIAVAAAIYLLITWLTGAKILRESLDYLRKKK